MTTIPANDTHLPSLPPISHGKKGSLKCWGFSILTAITGAGVLATIGITVFGILATMGIITIFGSSVTMGLLIGGAIAATLFLAALLTSVTCCAYSIKDCRGGNLRRKN